MSLSILRLKTFNEETSLCTRFRSCYAIRSNLHYGHVADRELCFASQQNKLRNVRFGS